MARTLIEVYLHIVFSTKHRANIIHPEIEADLHRYIAASSRTSIPGASPSRHREPRLDQRGVSCDARYLWD